MSKRGVMKKKREMLLSVGKSIKENRIRCNMSQEKLAKFLGFTKQLISKWENGYCEPTLCVIVKMNFLFETDLLKKEIFECMPKDDNCGNKI